MAVTTVRNTRLMLFAVIDYLHYKYRRGRYSDQAIRGTGGRLATASNFPGIADFGPEHLFVCHTVGSFKSWLVMYFTSSIWSHIATFSRQGNVVDATTSGVIEHPFSDYFDGRSYIQILTLKEKLSPDQISKMLAFFRRQIGNKYNWRGGWMLFFSIIFGAHASYRWRFSADILIALLMLLPFTLLCPPCAPVFFAFGGFYLLIVFSTTHKRRQMRRIRAEQGIQSS